MSDFTNNNHTPTSARVTANRDLVTLPVLWKWAVEGKVFEAGAGMEDTAIAALAAVNDQTASFALQAPASTSLLVIPILVKFSLQNDGNALTQASTSFTKPAGLCATAMTLSGTALTSKHAVYRKNPALTAQQATAIYTVTPSALVAADYVEYDRRTAVDAALTTGVVNFGNGASNVYALSLLSATEIHIMTSGAAMLVSVINSTTDATFKPYIMWAEVTESDLI